MSLGTDAVGQLHGGESRSATQIEQAVARPEAGPVPEIVRPLGPQAVLGLETGPLIGVGAEQIGFFRRGIGARCPSHPVILLGDAGSRPGTALD